MQFAAVAVLLLAGIYTLPDAGEIPAPEATQQARITKALRALRTSDWETGESAVRELALVGEVALPSIAKRLNKAEAGERLMLLAAVSHMPRGRPLLEQARGDPHAAVSAWASGPPPRRKTDLRQLANRYLDLLALAEEKLRDYADEDLKRVQEPRGEKESPTLEKQRRLLEEQRRLLEEQRRRLIE
ncbi:MAG: hypothetical protein ACYTDU_14180, partial [Planctomycetota bacterium]